MTVSFRRGVPDDAYQIAELLHIASGGISEFLLHDILPNCEILDLIALGVTDKSATISFSKTLVAEKNKKVQGILNFYPVSEHKIPEIMLTFIPQDRIEHISALFKNLVDDSLYLHAIAVREIPSGHNIGTVLVLKAIEYAKTLGITKLSAHVWSHNSKVLRVLLKKGFEIYDVITLQNHPRLPGQNQMFLLSYSIK